MRLNKFIAENTDLSRRKADNAIENGRVKINEKVAKLGDTVTELDKISIDGNQIIITDKKVITILLNKPVGYVCSRDGQGAKTVYDLLPEEYRALNIAGRLDKDSSGLVILTSDGNLLQELTHPSKNKKKIYIVDTNKSLSKVDIEKLLNGVDIGDERLSMFKSITTIGPSSYEIILEEGRNRQIRRTLDNLSIEVINLKRVNLGQFSLNSLGSKQYISII
jgi:23S rRNA pseudouridine2605 synthase